MRRNRLSCPFTLLVLFLAIAAPTEAHRATEGESVFRVSYVMLSKLEDGRPSGKYMVVNISVDVLDAVAGRYAATWDAVRITPITLHSGKTLTALRAQHYSTAEGSIRNIVVKNDRVTFDIARSHGDMNVVCERKGEFGYDVVVRASGTHNSSKRHRTYLEEWVMTDEISLPSTRVFGYPEKKPPR